ncbi:MAG: C-terminal helicase domain-containing protein, partial [Cellulomonas sp.]|nr:C-terminal helicase domain-containing protein [Cellulomonas sp.]
IHGDLGQGAREQALRAFRHGKVDVLVATDVAARGIDVEDVTHVINYQCPEDEKIYLHRTGRTGRAGNKGTAVTFVDWDDMPRWGLIDKALELGIPEPVETYSASAHIRTDLDIPEGITGRLPRSQQTREGLGAEVLEDLGETGKHGGAPRSHAGRGSERSDRGAGTDRPAGAGGTGGATGSGRGGRGARSRSGRTGDQPVRANESATERPTAQSAHAEGSHTDAAPKSRNRNRRRTRGGRAGDGTAAPAPAPEG